MLPLFRAYPRLSAVLPYASLGDYPTPVEQPAALARELGLAGLFVKRDDLTGVVYGGNKVRKLEFLLGQAVRDGAKQVVTVGFAGSNHALATAVYARRLGLRSTSLLLPQANARYVRLNLRASFAHGAELRHVRGPLALGVGAAALAIRCRIRDGRRVAFVPGGGSSPLGIVGYVNAAFELQQQVAAGVLPQPDVIYVAMGSMGTTAGLLLGLRAAGLSSRVVAVRVIEPALANARGMLRLLRGATSLLRRSDPGFPPLAWSLQDLQIRDDYLGAGYARFSPAGVRAARLLTELAGLPANGAYTAKAFAALAGDAAAGQLAGKAVLFWNTFNSRDLAGVAAAVDYRQLPRAFHRYFTGALQPLERETAGTP
jgi:D-cysteine desulfhydrase